MNQQDRKKKTAYTGKAKKTAIKQEKIANKRWSSYVLSALLIITAAIFFQAIKFDFLTTWDDNFYVTENPDIKALTWSNIQLLFTKSYMNMYQPLTMVLYAFEYQLGGGNAAIFHFVNVLFHVLNTWLVYVFIKKITKGNQVVALFTAAFFGVHPMHVESVAWISETKDVLYSFFFLLSLITYHNYLKDNKIKHLIWACMLFLLSCMSKSAAVILPLVMLLMDYYTGRKFSMKMLVEKIPFFIISLVFGLISLKSQSSAIQDMAPDMTLLENISVVSFSFITYLFKAFVPINLSAVYPYPNEIGDTLPIMYYLSIPLCLLLFVLVWYSRKKGKDVIFGFLFFVLCIILVLQFVPVGAAALAERYTYIPYIGVFFIAGRLFDNFATKNNNYRRYGLVIIGLVFIVFSVLSFRRVGVWENGEKLFTDLIAKHPESGISYRLRGDYYLSYYTKKIDVKNTALRSEYLQKTVTDLEKALQYPLNEYNKGCVLYGLGSAYNSRGFEKYSGGDLAGALEEFGKVIKYSPDDAHAYFSMGSIKNETQDYAGALADFDKAISIDNNYFQAYNNRGSTRFNMKDYHGALEDFEKALALNPDFADAVRNRDMVLSIINSSK
ncbi:MAG TPA: tetratricopeptide repeat protein [Bacteroidales bacterium]|nr:tetratricopeptide repeat protein [Bacteroidales bacterium]HPB25344.1 tetratricopeptide repeat protein [Bacteroidales bacterium]HPI29781.1 tetratricopeptide repeat protein [Bacteroidales bacterium]HQN15912.1 tetratricopeptide repeat protein [Bacteroidales bacterium]HQP15499.1 tetratricopeptide repeat protein [Bacteroidales bacterium]